INDADWQDAENIKSVLSGSPYGCPVIFLSHRPETFDIAANHDFNVIQLSGHTHSGQIPPVEIVTRFFMRYNYGLYKKNGSTMYVTSGAGVWGPPMRLFNIAEVAVIKLVKN
ncbi:MAG: metallophosphoesterase, partial [Acidobacteriota bacterium]|nr:metallophosphoesterase [Acidobacteriota bacterium]